MRRPCPTVSTPIPMHSPLDRLCTIQAARRRLSAEPSATHSSCIHKDLVTFAPTCRMKVPTHQRICPAADQLRLHTACSIYCHQRKLDESCLESSVQSSRDGTQYRAPYVGSVRPDIVHKHKHAQACTALPTQLLSGIAPSYTIDILMLSL
jgi:hypothetical protein